MISHNHRPYSYPEYVSPLPAEDLIKIGSVKQDMYSQGVQQMDSYMNNLAQYGLDMVKSTDRDYFTTQLSNLTDAINKSAKGVDFSNLSNVRNLMSIGRPLQNDPHVITAIEGTKEFRRRQEVLKTLKPQFRSAANDWDFTNDMYQWLNDGQVGSQLNTKEYTPYRDLSLKTAKLVEKLEPNIRTQVVLDGKGHYTREQVKSITAERLREALQSMLDESDLEQLNIDTRFAIKDVSNDELQGYFINKYQPTHTFLAGQIKDYQDTAARRQLKEEELEDYSNLLVQYGALSKNLSNVLNGDANTAYQALFNQHFTDFITGQSQTYKYRQQDKTLQNDGAFIASMNNATRLQIARENREFQAKQAGLNQYVLNPDGTLYLDENKKPILKEEFKSDNRIEEAERKGEIRYKYKTLSDQKTLDVSSEPLSVGQELKYNDLSSNENISPALRDLLMKKAEAAMLRDDPTDDPNDVYFKVETNDKGEKVLVLYDSDFFWKGDDRGEVIEVPKEDLEPTINPKVTAPSDSVVATPSDSLTEQDFEDYE